MREPALPFDPIVRAGELWERRWGPSAAMRAATSIFRVQQLLLARFDAALRPHGLTFARYEVLVLLDFSRRGELPLKIIGSRLQVHPTSVTNTVHGLTATGHVARRRNPADGRGVLASITARGRATVEAATADLTALGFGLDSLDAVQLEMLVDRLAGIRAAAGDFPRVDDAPEGADGDHG